MSLRSMTGIFAVILVGMLLSESVQAQPEKSPAASAKPLFCLGSNRYRHPAAIEYADLSPDGRRLFTLSWKGVFVWDLQTGIARFLFHDERLRNGLRLAPDGKKVLSISQDTVAVWDAQTGKEIDRFDGSDSALTAAFAPDGQGVFILREKQMEKWGWDKRVQRIGKTEPYCDPVFSADGKWFAVAAPGKPLQDVVIYDARTLERKAILAVGRAGFGPHGNFAIVRAGFTPNGDQLATPRADGDIHLWDIATAKEVRTLKAKRDKTEKKERQYNYLLFSRDGDRLFVGTEAGTIRRWDVKSGEELAALRSHYRAITSLHLTADGQRLISTAADGDIRRWDAKTGKEIVPPDGYSGDLHARLDAEGRLALLLDERGRMEVWDLNTRRLRWRVRPSTKTAMSGLWVESFFGFLPDGRRVYLAEKSGKITIWNAADGKPPHTLELKGYDSSKPGRGLGFCVAAPDGRSLVIDRGRRLVRIDAASGKDIWQLPEFSPRTICYPPAFSPDGKTLFFGAATYENKPYTELRGKLELVRVAASTGKVVDREKVPTLSTGDLSWFEQPRIAADGRTLLVTYGMAEVILADASANKVQHGYPLVLDRCTLSPDGKWIIGAGLENLHIHAADTGKELFHLPIGKQTVQSLHVLPDGRRVLIAGRGGQACIWELKNPSLP